jgi:hypothetical protein
MQRIILQKVIFPNKTVCKCEDLYFRKIGLPTFSNLLDGKIMPFSTHQRINFDTYYNSLSLLKWTTYTKADSNYGLCITVKGKFILRLIHMFLESGGIVKYNIISTEIIDSPEKAEYDFYYRTENPFGCLTFTMECIEGSGLLFDAYYFSNIDSIPNKVRLGIGICTYKREKYVLNNVSNINNNILNNKNSKLKNNLEVFISDNANTLKLKNKHINVFSNKNTGGSGGFTRCMIEALKYNENNKNKLTHLLLMDDDVKFDTASLERTYTILTLLKPEYADAFIGGAMLKMEQPNIQHASGEYWHGERCENFVETYNSNKNLIEIKDILENENFTNANYQAWWFCAIPMAKIKFDNLSLPFFIKSDDIEFSIRNLKHLILLNGINVWHESFESKYSAPNEYYTVRNYLITAAVHKAPITHNNILTLLNNYFKHYICNYKYLEIEHLCNAINDFIKGVDYFKSIDLAELHKKLFIKGYSMVNVSDLPVPVTDDIYFRDISYNPNWNNSKRRLAKYTINGLLLPAKGYAVLGMWGGSYEQTYRKKFLVRYELHSKKGFILQRSLTKAYRCAIIYFKTKKNIIKNFDKAKQEFSLRWKELCNIDIWNQQLY